MRLPESRFQEKKSSPVPALVIILVVAFVVALVVTLVILVTRSETPLFAAANTRNEQTALDLWNAGEYEGVIETLDAELDVHPMDGEALALRGFARFYVAMEQVDSESTQLYIVDAIRDLRRTLLLGNSPLERQIRFILGKAYYHRGAYFYDSAIVELERARQEGEESVELYEYLGIAYRDTGDLTAARENLERAAELSGDYVHYLALADVIALSDNLNEALNAYRRVVDGARDPILVQRALLGMAERLRRAERYDDAMATYERLLEENASSADAHFGMGEIYLAREETDRARFEWREALRLDPNHIESFERLQEY